MNVLIIGQGIAGSCLAWELKRRGTDFTVADRPIAETASRVAAGLVNPLTGRAFRPGWRQEECLSAAAAFYPETERELGGSWWQKTPIFRELETEDQLEIWQERQTSPESCAYAGPLFPWPEHWEGRGKAAYTRGSAVLHVEDMVNAMRRFLRNKAVLWKRTCPPRISVRMKTAFSIGTGRSFPTWSGAPAGRPDATRTWRR